MEFLTNLQVDKSTDEPPPISSGIPMLLPREGVLLVFLKTSSKFDALSRLGASSIEGFLRKIHIPILQEGIVP